ncbi:MAG: hypothetical protein ACOCZL_03590 [Bacteroidota bacterium]
MRSLFFLLIITTIFGACKSKKIQVQPPDIYLYNTNAGGPQITIHFKKGKAHNHPLMAIWIEDMQGNFEQTLYVAESIGKGVFQHGDASSGKWMPGELRRPAALPVWSHRRGIQADDGLYLPTPEDPVPDAITGPTPPQSFIIKSKLENPDLRQFLVFFEINQTWDWNEFWTNNKYPDNQEYKTSAQPALVYKAIVVLNSGLKEYPMKLVGHSHYAGEDGRIYEDLSTFTTALRIAEEIKVIVE